MRDRKTSNGISIEKRIDLGLTYFFEAKDTAYDKAREIRSYIFPIYEDVKQLKGYKLEHTGWGVPS